MTTQTSSACDAFLDDLADIIAGDESALERNLDHLSDCDQCRDTKHDAVQVAEMIGTAGDDYVVPEDMDKRVLEALARAEKSSASTEDSPAAMVKKTDAAALVTKSSAPAAMVKKADAATAVAKDQAKDMAAKAPLWRRQWVQTGALAAAAAGLIYYATGAAGDDPMNTPSVASHGQTWTAAVSTIDRAASDGQIGILVRPTGSSDFATADKGTVLASGDVLRTDERTRVKLDMSDGSMLFIDHDSELTIGKDGRAIRLDRGSLVADVAHNEDLANAMFATANGTIEVLGTRFALTATAKHSNVRVIRGLVQLSSAQSTIDVRAGEEGTVSDQGRPEVAAVQNLASSVGWSELLSGEPEADRSPSGLGELMAYKPGEKRDRDWKLSLAKHRITVRIVGNIARTEIEETFHNDSPAVLEGVYKFPLPPDAKIERLALDVDGKMEEGAFVGKDRASKIWAGVIEKATPKRKRPVQEIIWVPGPWRDPALLEWQRGGRFELRIFPIPAKGSRTIQLAYTQVLAPEGKGRRYVYPLPHKAQENAAKDFSIDVRLAGVDGEQPPTARNYALTSTREGDSFRMAMNASNFQPRGDLIIDFAPKDADAEMRAWSFQGQVAAAPSIEANQKAGADPKVVAEQHLVAADTRATALIALRPQLPRWTESRRRDYVLVLDSSQSMVGERFTRASKLATALVARMDRRDRFRVMTCDAECQDFSDSAQAPSAAASSKLQDWLGAIEPAGSSDLVASLRRAAQTSHAPAPRDVWIMYLGDGLSTTGYRRLSDLQREVTALADQHRVSVSSVGIGGDSDVSALSVLARSGHGHFTPFVPGQRVELAALAVLESTFGASLHNAELILPPGLEDVAPGQLPTIRSGQEILITGRHSRTVAGDIILRGTVGGETFEGRYPLTLAPTTAAGNAFVPRLWASQMIEQLELSGRGQDKTRIVALSQAFGVMSRHTSLLVLESPAMFKAFGIDRARPAISWSGDEAAESVAYDSGLAGVGFGKGTGGILGDSLSGGFASGSGRSSASSGPSKKAKEAAKPRAPTSTAGAELDGLFEDESRRDRQSRPRGRRMVAMRKVYYRVGSVAQFEGVHPNIRQAIADTETALSANPDSRERHRNLVQALAYGGDLVRTREIAESWMKRDRLDAEALGYLADVLGRTGFRQQSIRMLSGAVDLQPDDVQLHSRLADAYQRIGANDRACAHRIALASIDDDNAEILAGAVRCQRQSGQAQGATRTLASIVDDKLRQQVDRMAAQPESQEASTGDLVLDAHWESATDLDISLITPRGKRLSWLGGRPGLATLGASAAGRETLSLRRIARGNYLIEVARTNPNDRTPVRGRVEVKVLGETQTLWFELQGDHAVVGRVAVQSRSRLVPM